MRNVTNEDLIFRKVGVFYRISNVGFILLTKRSHEPEKSGDKYEKYKNYQLMVKRGADISQEPVVFYDITRPGFSFVKDTTQ